MIFRVGDKDYDPDRVGVAVIAMALESPRTAVESAHRRGWDDAARACVRLSHRHGARGRAMRRDIEAMEYPGLDRD